jgi:hypothetical protein
MTSINRFKSAPLDLLDKIYADPSNIESACNDYNALRQDEQYANIEEEIEDAIASLDIDLIWEAVGPDAYDQHYAVGIQVRGLMLRRNQSRTTLCRWCWPVSYLF